MRWIPAVSLLILAVACKKAAVDTGPQMPVGIQHPDLPCTNGTIGMGEPPPAGTEIYCARVYPDGRIQRQGPAIMWHSPSRRKAQGAFLDDRKSGAWQMWHPNGAVAGQGSFVADNKEGAWVEFHGNGERASEGDYVGGKETGKWMYWSEDGLTRTEGKYDAYGKRQDSWIDYGADDQPIRERIYRNGRLVNQREYTD